MQMLFIHTIGSLHARGVKVFPIYSIYARIRGGISAIARSKIKKTTKKLRSRVRLSQVGCVADYYCNDYDMLIVFYLLYAERFHRGIWFLVWLRRRLIT